MPFKYKAAKEVTTQPQSQSFQEYAPWERPPLPTDEGLGIYPRQSTPGQVKNYIQSNEMQTEGLVKFAQDLGWPEHKITVFAQDMARSGRLKIVDREGMLTLIQMIQNGEIKAVLISKEDRLFRDETALEYNTFIQVCKKHNCIVIVPPLTIYNFANKRDVKEFRYQCEKAADFLDDYVGRLIELRERAILKGLYGGGYIPIGTTIDRRRTIEKNGEIVPNPNWKKFIRYEPHAKILDWCLEQFYQIHSLNSIVRKAEKEGVRFPEFTSDIDERSKRIRVKKAEDEKGGYLVTLPLLESVFTNAFYIGHLVRRGVIIRENEHDPLLDVNLWWYAFNYVSNYTFDGERREGKPAKRFLREFSDEQTLLKYVVASDKQTQSYVRHRYKSNGSKWAYSVIRIAPTGLREHVGDVSSKIIDECFIEWFRKKIALIKAHTDYSAEIQREQEVQETRREVQQTRLEIIKMQRANVLEELTREPSKNLPEETRKKLTLTPKGKEDLRLKDWELAAEEEAIEAELKQKPEQTKTESKALRYKHLVMEHGDHWEGYSISEKHKFLQQVIKEVEISFVAQHWIVIKIVWINPEWGIDTGYLWHKGRKGANPAYTEAELEIIRDLYPTATQQEILHVLPTRTWQSVIRQAYLMKLSRSYQKRIDGIPGYLSIGDIQFAEEKKIDSSKMMMDKYVCWSEHK